MGKFYIETTKPDEKTGRMVLFELHATTDISDILTSTVSTYPLEDGTEVSDHVVVRGHEISLQGVLTDVLQNRGDQLPVADYLNNLEQRIQRKESFTVYFSSVIKPIRNCLIARFNYSKNNQQGGEACSVSLTLTQARFANRAVFGAEPDVDFKTLVAEQKASAANKSNLAEPDISNPMLWTGKSALFNKKPLVNP